MEVVFVDFTCVTRLLSEGENRTVLMSEYDRWVAGPLKPVSCSSQISGDPSTSESANIDLKMTGSFMYSALSPFPNTLVMFLLEYFCFRF